MLLTWFGHSSFMIRTQENVTIYIDPYKGNSTEAADVILISHDHFDHFALAKINAVRADDTVIFSTRKVASQLEGVRPLSPGESASAGGIRIEAVESYNTNKPNHPRGSGIGFIIEAEGKKVYFAGDTDIIPEMRAIKADIALLPVGGTYTMGHDEAAEAVKLIKPKLAIPMHYGAGIIGTIEDAELFKEKVEAETETEVIIMNENNAIEI